MKEILSLIFSILMVSALLGQEINYEEISNQNQLPDGIKVYKGVRASPALELFYAEIDLSEPDLAIRPYLVNPTGNLPDLTDQVGAYLAINGGYFSGSTSFSSVVYPNEVKAENIKAVTRNSLSYPLIRSFFGITFDGVPSVDWVYHFGNAVDDIRKFEAPLPYSFNDPDPLPAPETSDGILYENLMVGIGGAPVLVKDGVPTITYNEEIMWGSGVGLANSDPRTAVGFTSENKVIFLVADGRQSQSAGVSLIELADIMIALGCIEALNLDGGGSSQMAVAGDYINTPSEVRNVPSILVVTHRDSLGLPAEPIVEHIIDTEFEEATQFGEDWFESANAGFYGPSPSLVHPIGDGSAYFRFEPPILEEALYEVYGWWVTSGNRGRDTPYITHHIGGTDTVRVDQTQNGSSWQFIGRYLLNENTKLDISNAASQGDFVVADAVKFVNFVEDFSIESLIANDDEAFIPTDEAVTINVLQNDIAFGLSALKFKIVEEPIKGVVTINQDLSLIYQANEGESGEDSFTYQICYGQLGLFCDEAKVQLKLQEVEEEDPVMGLFPRKRVFEFFPNPVSNKLHIEADNYSSPVIVRILGMDGKVYFKRTYDETKNIEIAMSQFSTGLYFLEISGKGMHEVWKISKK